MPVVQPGGNPGEHEKPELHMGLQEFYNVLQCLKRHINQYFASHGGLAGMRLDERRQRALSRYYLDAGAGGLAVGVHTT